MSVFKILKGTFQNAQQDIVDGLRALTSLDIQSKHEQLLSLKAREINLDAGADLLHSYQKHWSAIQTDTKESAKKAEEISSQMIPLFRIWDKHSETVAQFETGTKSIPTILTTLEQLHTLLDGLRKEFNDVEKDLEILENLVEEQELNRRCLEEQQKLAVYKKLKEAEAERMKVELAKLHAKKMGELEMAKKLTLQERREAFGSAFEEDLDYYKTHGHAGRLPTEFPKVTSLSEIELEEDKQALDSFLGPAGELDNEQGPLELSGEGAYFEDDYTADFSSKHDNEYDNTGFLVKQDIEFVDVSDYNISACTISQLDMEDDYPDPALDQAMDNSELERKEDYIPTEAEISKKTDQISEDPGQICETEETVSNDSDHRGVEQEDSKNTHTEVDSSSVRQRGNTSSTDAGEILSKDSGIDKFAS